MTGRGLVNPAFVIKIVPANDEMQQKPSGGRNTPTSNVLSRLKNGETISYLKGEKEFSGKISRIIKNELGDVIYVIVSDEKGKKIKIESSTITNVSNFSPVATSNVSAVVAYIESKFLSYDQFVIL